MGKFFLSKQDKKNLKAICLNKENNNYIKLKQKLFNKSCEQSQTRK